MNVEALYKDEIEALWNNNLDKLPDGIGKEIAQRGFAVERELPQDDVLFIGMNPAYDEDKDRPARFFYNISPPENRFFNEVVKFSDRARGYRNPSHHDLFFVRHKTQKDIEALIVNPDYRDFFAKQLAISADIIKKLSPKLIVVLNAGARSQFEALFDPGGNRYFDNDLGAFRFIINESTPVLFASMLSGARALDCGSRESLGWHINYILNKLQ